MLRGDTRVQPQLRDLSRVVSPQPFGRDPNGFADWTFSTVRCWGEEAQGTYRLVIRDIGASCLPGPCPGELPAQPPHGHGSAPRVTRPGGRVPAGPTTLLPRRRESEAWDAEAVAADPVRLLLVPGGDEGAAEVGHHGPSRWGDGRWAAKGHHQKSPGHWGALDACTGSCGLQKTAPLAGSDHGGPPCVVGAALQTVGGIREPPWCSGTPRVPVSPRLLEEAMSGRYLSSDFSLPCPPGLQIPEEQRYTITANTLKVRAPRGHPVLCGGWGAGT